MDAQLEANLPDTGTCTLSSDAHMPWDTAFLTFPSNEGGSEVSHCHAPHASWDQVGFEVQFMTLKQRFFLCVN